MSKTSKICSLVWENMTRCRLIWSVMYNLYFLLTCVSFHIIPKTTSTTGIIEKSRIHSTIINVALGLLIYVLLTLLVPLFHIIHQSVLKDKIEYVKRVLGLKLVLGFYKFLAMTTFPIVCIWMGVELGDTPILWMCIGLFGCVYSLLLCYIDPADYGSEAFVGMSMGFVLSVDCKPWRFVFIALFGLALAVSKEIELYQKRANEEAHRLSTLHLFVESVRDLFRRPHLE